MGFWVSGFGFRVSGELENAAGGGVAARCVPDMAHTRQSRPGLLGANPYNLLSCSLFARIIAYLRTQRGVVSRPACFRVQGSGFRFQGAEFWPQGAGFWLQGAGLRVEGQG